MFPSSFQPKRRHILGMGFTLAAAPTMAMAENEALLPPENLAFDVPLLQRARLAVVQILSSEEEALFPAGQGRAGSGFVVKTTDGIRNTIVTNAHVCEGKERMFVRTLEGSVSPAMVKRTNPLSDVALLQTENALPLPALSLASSMPAFAVPVVAIGAPHGYAGTVTRGHVSGGALGEANPGVTYRDDDPVDYIQHDAPINPGNSGGPLLAADGTVLGINTAIPDFTSSFSGIGLATPAAHINRELAALAQGEVATPWLGLHVQQISPPLAQALDVAANAGLLVAGVMPGSPAHKAGLEAGDILTSAENRRLKNLRDLGQLLLARQVGGSIKQVERLKAGTGSSIAVASAVMAPTLTLHLEATPREEENSRTVSAQKEKTLLTPGFTLRVSSDGEHTIIDHVEPNSPASDQGLAAGDVVHQINRKPVTGNEDLHRLWNESRGLHVALLVERAGDRPLHMLLPRFDTNTGQRGNQTDAITRLY